MTTRDFNNKERSLIDQAHSVFPKVFLNPEVAICSIRLKNGKYSYVSSFDMANIEAKFRDTDFSQLFFPKENEENFYYPSKYKPLPWWDIKKELPSLFFSDVTPYGFFYYLPAYILDSINSLAENRNQFMTPLFPLSSGKIGIPYDSCWKEIYSIPIQYRDPLNKRNLIDISRNSYKWFLIFISLFNEDQKRFISSYIDYAMGIGLENLERQWRENVVLYKKEVADEKRLKVLLRDRKEYFEMSLQTGRALQRIWSFK